MVPKGCTRAGRDWGRRSLYNPPQPQPQPLARSVLFVEDIERRQADVRDFLLTENDLVTRTGLRRRRDPARRWKLWRVCPVVATVVPHAKLAVRPSVSFPSVSGWFPLVSPCIVRRSSYSAPPARSPATFTQAARTQSALGCGSVDASPRSGSAARSALARYRYGFGSRCAQRSHFTWRTGQCGNQCLRWPRSLR
jgi:hypothetical protein